tara:strand:+ start:6198 stop:6746 length:549 start_codon:yes stop_codon:yes gene_type:complete
MADYTQTTFFATKDNLASGDAAKVIKGSEVDAELLAIKNAVNSKTETGDVPSGSAMLFMQASAPVGWQQVTTHNDKALRVVSGTGNGTGGSVGFTTAFANGNTGDKILTIANLPAHTHNLGTTYDFITQPFGSTGMFDDNGSDRGVTDGAAISTSSVGSGTAHNHSLTLAVQYIDVIVCTKD